MWLFHTSHWVFVREKALPSWKHYLEIWKRYGPCIYSCSLLWHNLDGEFSSHFFFSPSSALLPEFPVTLPLPRWWVLVGQNVYRLKDQDAAAGCWGQGRKNRKIHRKTPTSPAHSPEAVASSEVSPCVRKASVVSCFTAKWKWNFFSSSPSHQALTWPCELPSICVSYGFYVIKYVAYQIL